MTTPVRAEEATNSHYTAVSEMKGPTFDSSLECAVDKIELSLSCCKLADTDTFSKSDPSNSIIQLGRTEVIWNNLNPVFVRKFVIDYIFGKTLRLKFEVYDEKLSIQFCAKDLDRKDVFGTSDPFLRIYKLNEDNSETLVHKTEVVKNNLNPRWQSFEISVRTLCNNDYVRQAVVHKLIGYFTTSLEQLKSGAKFKCQNPKKKGKQKKSGEIAVLTAKIEHVYTFIDYIKTDTQINCLIAVDFTDSNGNPRDPKSLHCLNSNKPNAYVEAMEAVGSVIAEYDSDGLFPAWGFGARLPPDGAISHCFPLNDQPSNPYCKSIDGVLDAYKSTLDRVRLSGPTLFAPCINQAAGLARKHTDGSEYFILLILTDGVICDMENTCKAIVGASSLPLSIIIIGIGDADFEAMKILDGDEQRLTFQGQEAERDIVQFFNFSEFEKMKKGRSSNESTDCKMILAAEVLAEVPGQFLSYMQKNNLRPGQV
ncbi:hypothetical protein LSH36_125g04042 [Paralvinella palmiformis]|uniref:C2 domain-containing protein n=1 Tax=Paralvinella palmiformis TaxID=53620 RepID=A0AAD9JYP2_9ANNE|nr:hypothetical protein LSH36_125g04042 [Paralvinella palmiformis]